MHILTARLDRYDLRKNEHRDTGTQICTELSLQLLFRLTTTDSLLPIPSHLSLRHLSLKLKPNNGTQRPYIAQPYPRRHRGEATPNRTNSVCAREHLLATEL